MTCLACGSAMAPDAAACGQCGSRAGSAAAAAACGQCGNRAGSAAAAAAWTAAARAVPSPRYSLGGLAAAVTAVLALTAAASLGAVAAPVLEAVAGWLLVPLIPLFLTWFYLARQNAEGRGWLQRRGPGWAIGAWFVPVLFLWFPYQIMADIWRAGLPAAERRKPALLPGSWWACWLLAWLTSVRYVSIRTATVRSDSVNLYFGDTVLSKLFEAGAALLLIAVVLAVSRAGAGRPPQTA